MKRKRDLRIMRDKYLTGIELCQLYAWISEHEQDPLWQDQCFLVRFVLGTGLRVSEIPGLRHKEDVDRDGLVFVAPGKTGMARIVKVIPELHPYLRERLDTLTPPCLLFSRKPVNNRIYTEPYQKRSLFTWWKDVLRAAGVRPLGIHAGRHTFATHEVGSRRLQIHEAQHQLGHTDVAMTLEFYTHSAQEYLYQDGPPEWRDVALNGRIARRADKVRCLRVVV